MPVVLFICELHVLLVPDDALRLEGKSLLEKLSHTSDQFVSQLQLYTKVVFVFFLFISSMHLNPLCTFSLCVAVCSG